MKRKFLVTIVSLAVLVVGIVVNTPEKNPTWGIRLETSDVSASGMTLTMTRRDDEKLNLSTGEPYGLERWCITGWNRVEGKFVFNMPAYRVDEDYEYTWVLNWEESCGKLPIGLYRISKQVDYEQVETKVFCAPFVVAEWWQILVVLSVIVLLFIGIWWICSKGIWKKFIAIKDDSKKMKALFLILLIIGFAWMAMDDCKPFVLNAIRGIKVRVESTSLKAIEGTMVYKDDGRENTTLCMERDANVTTIERRTIIGWRKVNKTTISRNSLSGSQYFVHIKEGELKEFQLNLERLGVNMSDGIYRLKQEVTLKDMSNIGKKEKKKAFYMVFRVKDDSLHPEYGPIGELEQSNVVANVRRTIIKDENHQSYLGGIYLKNKNVIVNVTNQYRKASPGVKKFLRNEDGVIVRKVKYTENELKEIHTEVWEKLTKLEEQGDEETLEFLKDIVSSSTDVEQNCVTIGIAGLDEKKEKMFWKIFGKDKRIVLERGYSIVD